MKPMDILDFLQKVDERYMEKPKQPMDVFESIILNLPKRANEKIVDFVTEMDEVDVSYFSIPIMLNKFENILYTLPHDNWQRILEGTTENLMFLYSRVRLYIPKITNKERENLNGIEKVRYEMVNTFRAAIFCFIISAKNLTIAYSDEFIEKNKKKG